MRTQLTDDDLYHIALYCEEQKQRGCVGNCGMCQYNVALLASSFKDAAIIRTTAAVDANKIQEYKKNKDNTSLALILMICGAIFGIIKACDRPKEVIKVERPTNVKQPTIVGTIETVHIQLRDVNKDGLVNCIDYAILFHIKYGDRSRIIHNTNPAKGFNHLFNYVLSTSNVWMAVEPQGNNGNWPMSVYWKDSYDSQYDVDETSYWREQYHER
jgi:hypothetical protein